MAVLTLYFKNAAPSGSASSLSLQDGGTAPATGITTTGWVVSTLGSTRYSLMVAGSEQLSTSFGATFSDALSTPSFSAASSWRSENPYTGTFANTNWTLTFRLRAVTIAASQTVAVRCRLWKSANAGGTSATQLTSTILAGSTTAVLSTSASASSTMTWTPGATTTFSNEYFWVQCEVVTGTSGTNVNADADFYIEAAGAVTTPNFLTTEGRAGVAAGTTAGTTATGVAIAADAALAVGSGIAHAVGTGIKPVQAIGIGAGVAHTVGANVTPPPPPTRTSNCLLEFETIADNLIFEDNSGFLALEICVEGSIGTAPGSGTALGVGAASPAQSFGLALGTGVASAVGIALVAANASAASGTGTASAVGAAINASAGTALGTGTAAAVSDVAGVATGSASGLGTAAGDGAALAESEGITTGFGIGSAFGISDDATRIGNADGFGTASAVGAATVEAPGSADGFGTAAAVTEAVTQSAGSADGTGTAAGIGAADSAGVGNAIGLGTAFAFSDSNATTGVASGLGTASAVGGFTVASAGTAQGLGTASAVGEAVIEGPPIVPEVPKGGAGFVHRFTRKRWRELMDLIAAEKAARAKAEKLDELDEDPGKQQRLLEVAQAAAEAIRAAEIEGENARLDRELERNANAIRAAIRAANQVKLLKESARAIAISHEIARRRKAAEDEEEEMITLLLMS